MITHEEARNILLYSRPIKDKRKIFDYIDQQETLQAEHEALKKDFARFMELSFFHKAPYSYRKHYADKHKLIDETILQAIFRLDAERFVISQKLSKVGKGEWRHSTFQCL